MASSNKTDNLGLNLWLPSDRPKREDFVRDNEILEEEMSNLQSGILAGFGVDDGSLLKWDDENKQIVRAVDGVDYWSSNTLPIESGTWVPQLVNSGLNMTSHDSRYIRMGRFVLLHSQINLDRNGSPTANAALISGLPFPVSSDNIATTGELMANVMRLPANGISPNISTYSAQQLRANYFVSGGGYGVLLWNAFPANVSYLSFTISYATA